MFQPCYRMGMLDQFWKLTASNEKMQINIYESGKKRYNFPGPGD